MEVTVHSREMTVGKVLDRSQPFQIDFYQREYSWKPKDGEDPVLRLLDDVFNKFNEKKKRIERPKDKGIREHIEGEYDWYFLNTIVTHDRGGCYLVDGQQRITTLMLIMMVFERLKKKVNSEIEVEDYIITKGDQYVIRHEKVDDAMLKTLREKGPLDVEKHSKHTTTERCIIDNSEKIENWMEDKIGLLKSEIDKDESRETFESLFYYFIHKVVLVNLLVGTESASEVFEVLNDRGVRLKPHQILKAKLFGRAERSVLFGSKAPKKWEERIKELEDKKLDPDTFFEHFLRAKCYGAQVPRDLNRVYHKSIFDQGYFSKYGDLGKMWRRFFEKEFLFFTKVYMRLSDHEKPEHEKEEGSDAYFLAHNRVHDTSLHRILVLAAVQKEDSEEVQERKMKSICREAERFYALTKLQEVFSSNAMNNPFSRLAEKFRELKDENYRPYFNKELKNLHRIKRGENDKDLFTYGYFQDIGYGNKNLCRYVLARTERFLEENLGEGKAILFERALRTTGKGAYHLDHVLGENKPNEEAFWDEKKDEEGNRNFFQKQRDRLGALVLLKERVNKSFGNAPYSKKLEYYHANGFLWSKMLSEKYHKMEKPCLKDIEKKYEIKPETNFKEESIDRRQRTLFNICKEIWEADDGRLPSKQQPEPSLAQEEQEEGE